MEKILIAIIKGRLDATQHSILFHNVTRESEQQSIVNIMIDIKDMEYVSSCGFREFLNLGKYLHVRDGKLIFCSPRPNILRIFEIAQLNTLYPIVHNREEGLKFFAN